MTQEGVERAAEERVRRERRAAEIERRREAIKAIVEQAAKLPVLDNRSPDAILGYDETGLPT